MMYQPRDSSSNPDDLITPEKKPLSSLPRSQQRVLQIPRSKIRLINETKQVSDSQQFVEHEAQSKNELIRVQDSRQGDTNSRLERHQIAPGVLLESSTSPEVPDRKRYTIKNRHNNNGIYTPSFTVQPNQCADEPAWGAVRDSRLNEEIITTMHEQSFEYNKINPDASPKIVMRKVSAGDELIVDSQMYGSKSIRKVSLPSGRLSLKTNDAFKSRVRGDIKAYPPWASQFGQCPTHYEESRQSNERRDAIESTSSVVMANGFNQSQHDSYSASRDSNRGVTVTERMQQDHEMSRVGQALNKVIQGGYRTKSNFRTPLQRGSNNSNFINYQNSLASESIERRRVEGLGLGNQAQLKSVADRSFSIQPQYRLMHQRMDELSRGSSQEHIDDIYQNIADVVKATIDQSTGSLNVRLTASRGNGSHQHKARVLNSRQRREQVDSSYLQKRNQRSPFETKLNQTVESGIKQQANQLKVPGIMMDSINSQKLRSKSTFRGNQAGSSGFNKLTSLQTMAHTSDQQLSSAGAGGIMGLTSIQSYLGGNGRDRTNIDRCALLEEIEKSKIEEIKQKTLKNLDKYAKKQVLNAANINKFTDAATIKYVPKMNVTVGSQGANCDSSNPFAQNSSKMQSRSKLKSKSGVSAVESQLSKNSIEKIYNANDSISIDQLNEQLRDRNISPQKSRVMNSSLTKSPILVQQQYKCEGAQYRLSNNNQRQESQLSTTTPGIFKSGSIGGASQTNSSVLQLGSSIEGSQIKRKLNRNTINLAKLSLVLKNNNNLNVSQNDGNGSLKIPDKLYRFQRDEINSIANILNETLSKLKKPNTHFLQPLSQSSGYKNQVQNSSDQKHSLVAKNSRLHLLNIVGGIRQSIQATCEPDRTQLSANKDKQRSQSPAQAPDDNSMSEEKGIAEEEVELDLDDLTQEDKFYLIQQIEAVQKNIRYYSANQETYVFQDFDEGKDQGTQSKATSYVKDLEANQKSKGQMTGVFESRYNANDQEETFTEQMQTISKQNPSNVVGPKDQCEKESPSPKMTRNKVLGGRRLIIGTKALSPPGDLSRNSHSNSNAISFVTSALGLLAQESLEIIEDADEVEEDELDNINLCEQKSPLISPQAIEDFTVQQCEEPPSPGHSYGPFKHPTRKLRRNLNENQKQILSKGDLKRYKVRQEDILDEQIEDQTEGPEEVSVLLHRGSKVVKDFDVIRFSKGSSANQNNVRLDPETDLRAGIYTGNNSQLRNARIINHSNEQLQRRSPEQRSPMSIRRSPGIQQQNKKSKLRKLTNSLFEDSAFTEFHNVIHEEEKEKDEQD